MSGSVIGVQFAIPYYSSVVRLEVMGEIPYPTPTKKDEIKWMKMKKVNIIIIILLFICSLSLIIVSCAPSVQPDEISKGTITLVARAGSIEVWKFTDKIGAMIQTCYVTVNTYSTSGANPSIACP